jgi:pyruvate dehydrogenase E1 component beta subunit
MEQLIDNAAKLHYVSNGAHKVPLVVRLIIGRGWGQGPAHSQSLEGLFASIPGLKVVMPSSAGDAKSLLLGAIQDDNPVIFIEHRWVHYATGEVPEGDCAAPLTGPKRIRQGSDVTILSTSYMTLEAMQAAEVLAAHGIEAELVDLRLLNPINLQEVYASVRRTGRLLTVDTGYMDFGIGAEVVSRVTENCFDVLQAPPKRLGLGFHPTPSSRALAAAYYPRSPHIAEAVGRLLKKDDKEIKSICKALQQKRENIELDVPHPSFKGPF